jgi:hypothetical protein
VTEVREELVAPNREPGSGAETLRVTEVREELIAPNREPGSGAETLRVTEVRVDLHDRSACQQVVTVLVLRSGTPDT